MKSILLILLLVQVAIHMMWVTFYIHAHFPLVRFDEHTGHRLATSAMRLLFGVRWRERRELLQQSPQVFTGRVMRIIFSVMACGYVAGAAFAATALLYAHFALATGSK